MDWLATEIGKLSLLGIYGLIAGAAGSLLSGYIFPKWLQKQKSELARPIHEAGRFVLVHRRCGSA